MKSVHSALSSMLFFLLCKNPDRDIRRGPLNLYYSRQTMTGSSVDEAPGPAGGRSELDVPVLRHRCLYLQGHVSAPSSISGEQFAWVILLPDEEAEPLLLVGLFLTSTLYVLFLRRRPLPTFYLVQRLCSGAFER
jgi:hypothetical protein